MVNFHSLLQAALVAVVLTVASGDPGEKLATCCEKVNRNEITEPILGYLIQKASYPCVNAVIFQTETGLYCSQVNAPWVRHKIREFRRAKGESKISSAVSSSPVSLLSILTSTASSPSPSTLPPSSSSSIFTSASGSSSGDVFSGSEEDETSTLPPSSSSPIFTSASGSSSGDVFSGSEEDETSTSFW